MGCCKEVVNNKLTEFEGLPRTTFYCLARMSYQLACAAETFYTGRERLAWDKLSDAECDVFTDRVMTMISGRPPKSDDQLDLLCFKMVHQLTTNV
jgi:hypothetical protein